MSRTAGSCDWIGSAVDEEHMKHLTATGFLPAQEVIQWRIPGEEITPEPKDGEVVVFTDHSQRGFCPPGSKFFRDVLHFLKLHPQDI